MLEASAGGGQARRAARLAVGHLQASGAEPEQRPERPVPGVSQPSRPGRQPQTGRRQVVAGQGVRHDRDAGPRPTTSLGRQAGAQTQAVPEQHVVRSAVELGDQIGRLTGGGADEHVLEVGQQPQRSAATHGREGGRQLGLVEVRGAGPAHDLSPQGGVPGPVGVAGVDGDPVAAPHQGGDQVGDRADVARERHHRHQYPHLPIVSARASPCQPLASGAAVPRPSR